MVLRILFCTLLLSLTLVLLYYTVLYRREDNWVASIIRGCWEPPVTRGWPRPPGGSTRITSAGAGSVHFYCTVLQTWTVLYTFTVLYCTRLFHYTVHLYCTRSPQQEETLRQEQDWQQLLLSRRGRKLEDPHLDMFPTLFYFRNLIRVIWHPSHNDDDDNETRI